MLFHLLKTISVEREKPQQRKIQEKQINISKIDSKGKDNYKIYLS